jgi:MOSC domain-containing protein YiiM
MALRREEEARRQRAQQTALFRYALVSQAIDPELSTKQRGALIRELAARDHKGPDGRLVRVSRTSLDRWVRALRELIHHNARGLPRGINNLAIQALMASYATQKNMVDQKSANQAILEMGGDDNYLPR